MRDLIVLIVAVAVLTAASTHFHRPDPTRAGSVPSVGPARAYCDIGQGFRPCAFVEPNGAKT